MPIHRLFCCVLTLLVGLSLPVQLAHAQEDETLRVVTWNVEWLNDADPSNDRSAIGPQQAAPSQTEYAARLETFADAIDELAPDVLALQEVESRTVAQDLADLLLERHAREYDVAFVQGRDTYTGQDVAFLVKPGLLLPDSERRINFGPFAGDDRYKDLSKHLRIDLEVNGERFTLITVHLISSNAGDRRRQAETLRAWTVDMVPQSNLILLGDFNASQRFNQTTPDSEMGIIRGFASESVDDDLFDAHMRLGNRATHVGGSELDRILLSPSLVDALLEVDIQPQLATRGTADRGSGVDYSLPQAEQDLSDHFPLAVTLALDLAPAGAPTAIPITPAPAVTSTATVSPAPVVTPPASAAPRNEELAYLLDELARIEEEIRRLTEELLQVRLLIEELVE